MKIFNEILDKHTKMYNCKRESYMINDDLEILISQDGNKVAFPFTVIHFSMFI